MDPLSHSGFYESGSGRRHRWGSFMRRFRPANSAALGRGACWDHARFHGRTRLGEWPAKWVGKCLTCCRSIFNNKTGFYHMKSLSSPQDSKKQHGWVQPKLNPDQLKQGNMAEVFWGASEKPPTAGTIFYRWKAR